MPWRAVSFFCMSIIGNWCRTQRIKYVLCHCMSIKSFLVSTVSVLHMWGDFCTNFIVKPHKQHYDTPFVSYRTLILWTAPECVSSAYDAGSTVTWQRCSVLVPATGDVTGRTRNTATLIAPLSNFVDFPVPLLILSVLRRWTIVGKRRKPLLWSQRQKRS